MSGHSKWSTIKHKKGAADAKRGKVFTKIIREVTTAARIGGGDIEGNPRLRKAVDLAKASNMPNENVERAIKKGTGELEGVVYEEIVYEGYGPEGVAVMVEVMTDNRNRTVSEIRHLFTKYNGNLGANGCVAWMFPSKGQVLVPKDAATEDHLMEVTLEAGAEDITEGEEFWTVTTSPEAVEAVQEALRAAGIAVEKAEATRIPTSSVSLEGKSAETTIKLVTALEDHDDVQNVYANFDVDDELLERLGS
jgi:YebC/PmpR family DNA-binding regulatory protein